MTRTPVKAAEGRAQRRRAAQTASGKNPTMPQEATCTPLYGVLDEKTSVDASDASEGRVAVLGLFLALPSQACLPNVRANRWLKMQAVEQDRTDARYTAMQLLRELGMEPPRWGVARVRVQFRFPNRVRRDTSNYFAGMKPQWDGLVDAGILRDDELVIWDIPLRVVDRARPGVDVRIEEVSE